tara:strand:- start:699 stop:995 length:297 start_codon:yes stop_codon:yes gene_type:complete
MKNPLAGIIRMFQPKYSVIVNMYHVIPGTPVKKFEHRHDFGKGEYDQASMFYHKVVKKHTTLGFPNTEIELIKGRKTIVERKIFGPVDVVKTLNVKSA